MNIIITGHYFTNKFFKKFNSIIFRSEQVDTHGGSIRVYIKKGNKVKIESSMKQMLKDEEKVWY